MQNTDLLETTSDISVEFAHIYSSDEVGAEHEEGTLRYKQLRATFGSRVRPSATILIDERTGSNPAKVARALLASARAFRVNIDIIGYEGRFVAAAESVMARLSTNDVSTETFRARRERVTLMRGGLHNFGLVRENSTGQRSYSCALLSAAWTLCRLGELEVPKGAFTRITKRPFAAKSAITILPARYEAVESKAMTIIATAGFNVAARVSHHYF